MAALGSRLGQREDACHVGAEGTVQALEKHPPSPPYTSYVAVETFLGTKAEGRVSVTSSAWSSDTRH